MTCVYYCKVLSWLPNQNQTFHYTRRIMPKRVTSLRCPSPRYNAKAIPLLA